MDSQRIDTVVAKVELFRKFGLVLCYAAYPFVAIYKLLTGQAWNLREAIAAFNNGVDNSLWEQFSRVRDDFSVRECAEIKLRLFPDSARSILDDAAFGGIFSDPGVYDDLPCGCLGDEPDESGEPTRPERRSEGRHQ